MCGIVGAFPLNKVGLEIDATQRKLLTLYLHNEVLLETISRGKDATGVAISFQSPEEGAPPFWNVLKQPVDVIDFLSNNGTQLRYKGQDEEANYERMMDVSCLLDWRFNHIIGHTRAKTVGSEYKPLNNHPIMVGNIIGIHNGGVTNHKQIYEKHPEMTQQGDVDSEAIFQLLAEVGNDRELNADDIKYVTERIEGPRAVIAYNRLHPGKIIFFRNQPRPIELAYVPELGLALMHSERKFMEAAMHAYNRMRLTVYRDLPELTHDYVTVLAEEGGVIDINAEIDDTKVSKYSELFPLVKTAKMFEEYSSTYKPPLPKSQPVQATWEKENNTPSNLPKTTDKKKSGQKLATAEVVDFSDYTEEKSTKTEAQGQVTLPDSAVMDDTEDSETIDINNLPDGDADVTEIYTENELRAIGAEWALSDEARKDKTLYVNRHEGKYADAISMKGLREEDCAELVHQIFPEMASEGFAAGYRMGYTDHAQATENNEETEETQQLQSELEDAQRRLYLALSKVEALEKELEKEKDKQFRAGNYIANMKMLMAAYFIVMQDTATIEDFDGAPMVEFNADVEQYIYSHEAFEKVSPGAVRELFSTQDAKTILERRAEYSKQSMVATSKIVTEATSKESEAKKKA